MGGFVGGGWGLVGVVVSEGWGRGIRSEAETQSTASGLSQRHRMLIRAPMLARVREVH